ncbi:voltage-gated chloride channel family protein [Paenibacillus cremeus]|uniref:Voltage-gated chloride channel family protein n=1 Tax=Paenibacillus cremeus TaxID=2163881 RepID=A0A559KHV4_9BACL|nr:voltage-gated chloride channel family protein [Paenibacillus cremeus]TVY11713.1 voltage-gated chloride channel family protein [Paenibacillus cremeus]
MDKTKQYGRRLLLAETAWFWIKWIILGSLVGLLTGSASAFFLNSLERVTELRLAYPWLLFGLPAGGALVSYLYMKVGKNSAKGNNLILEQIGQGSETIPLRMAPLVLLGTVLTHLFGGSAGREGTAVQMGGSLSEWLGKRLRVSAEDRKLLLMCGISSGFGSVFGTPLAGTVFGLEVVAIGMIRHEALLPCLVASFVGDLVTTRLWEVHHAHYAIGTVPSLGLLVLVKVAVASVLFGWTSILFSELTHGLKKGFSALFRHPVLKSAVGGCIVIVLVYTLGTRDYLGLGLPLLSQSFTETTAPLAFLWKTIFTSITLGAGFQGGEVTPLFVIGATLGNALGSLLHIQAPFLAGLGLIAVFSGATNTPIACFLMGLELFGAEGAIFMFIAVTVSYLFSGHTGIYSSQRIAVAKSRRSAFAEGSTLALVRELERKRQEG